MSVFAIDCPECKATLRSSKPVPTGKVVTCPKCSVMFPAPVAKPQAAVVHAGVDVVDDEFADVEIVEDPPKKKAPPKPRIADEDRPRKRNKKSNTGFIIGLTAGLVAFAAFAVGATFAVRWLLAENNDPVAYMPPKPMVLGSIDIGKAMETPLGPTLEGLLNSGEFAKYCQDAGVSPRNAVDRMTFGMGTGSRPGSMGAIGEFRF